MIDAAICWNEKNIKEYVKYVIIDKNKGTKAGLAVFVTLMAIIGVTALVLAFVTGFIWIVGATVCAALMIAVFLFILRYAVNKYSKDIYNINSDSSINGIVITDASICVKKDEAPKGFIQWSSVISFEFFGNNAYMSTAEGFLVIIEKENIKAGSLDELKKIVDEKLVKQSD